MSFDYKLVADIGDAILARLVANANLGPYFRKGGIEGVESADVRAAAGYIVPALFVEPWAEDETPLLSGSGDLDTLWRITMLKQAEKDWRQRSLIVQEIKAVLAADHGRLLDPLGNPLTESIVRFQSITNPEPIDNNATLRTRIRVQYRSQITVMTREFEA